MGGRYPRGSGRAMYYSARATALMQPPAREGARRVVNGAGVRRQQGHLSGRATAWVERNDSLRAVLVAAGALCKCSHVIPRYSKPRRTLPPSLKLGQDIIARQVGRHNRIPLALQQPYCVQCIKSCKTRQSFGHAQAESLESSPPRPIASKRSKRILFVSLATKNITKNARSN